MYNCNLDKMTIEEKDFEKMTQQEKNSILDKAHEIVLKRYMELGLTQTSREKEICEWTFEGILQFEGVNALMDYCKNAQISKPKKNEMRRGY